MSTSAGNQRDNAQTHLQNITQVFRNRSGKKNVALNNVSLTLAPGEILAIVGESGSGKSTLGLIAAGVLRPTAGFVQLGSQPLNYTYNSLKDHHKKVQLILQNPFASLNPVHNVLHHLSRPLKIHRHLGKSAEIRHHASLLLESVGLSPSEEFVEKYPHQLSGGQRQRVGIARALATDPKLIVADEPTSMLDVSLRLDMLNLLLSLRKNRQTSFLFITHDLASAHYIADTIAVIFRGNIVERGAASQIVKDPKHPYTQLLLHAITETIPPNTVSSTAMAPSLGGCVFRFRCPLKYERCDTESPRLQKLDGTEVACHYVEVQQKEKM